MSYVTSCVVLEPTAIAVDRLMAITTNRVVLEYADQDDKAPWRACYLKALWRRMGHAHSGAGIAILVLGGDGRLVNPPFLHYSADGMRANLRIPDQFRDDVAAVLRVGIAESRIGRLVFFCEPTFWPLGIVPEESYDTFPVENAVSMTEFWQRHDRDELQPGIIYILSE
jgi:hypothetical protein